MSTVQEKANDTTAIGELLGAEDDQLLVQLGMRTMAMTLNPAVAGSYAPDVTWDGTQMGGLDDLKKLGRRLFRRWNQEAFKLVCGDDPDDKGSRDEIKKAIGMGNVTLAAVVAGTLVSSFGLAPAVAGVVAALVVKRVLKPTHEEVCAVWREKL